MKIIGLPGVALAGLLAGAAPALAHHSFAAQYDATKPVAMQGVVTQVDWTNPHAHFYIDVKDENGQVKSWNFELASPNVLVRNGWKRTTLRIGDQIAVTGYLAKLSPPAGPQMAVAASVTTPDGRELFASAPQGQAR